MLVAGRCKVCLQVGRGQRMTIHDGQTAVAGHIVVINRAALEVVRQQTGLQTAFTCNRLDLFLFEVAHLIADHLLETPRFRAALLLETCKWSILYNLIIINDELLVIHFDHNPDYDEFIRFFSDS